MVSSTSMTWKKHPSTSPNQPDIHSFLEPKTSTWQYLVVDPSTSEAVVIDSVLDYDPASGTLSTDTADGLLRFIQDNKITVTKILETHAHADHLSAAQYLKHALDRVPVCIGHRITQVQETFAPVYGFQPVHFKNTFDKYLQDDEEFPVGNLTCKVIHLPGHTPDHVGYVFGSQVFTGDSIFMPDVGSARADFPGGNAKDLYSSMKKLLSMPETHKIFVGHDYPPNGRTHEDATTVSEHIKCNNHHSPDEDTFIEFRETRDKGLGAPRLLHPSLQVNIRAGKLPPADENGRRVMKIPLDGSASLLDVISSSEK